MKIFKSLILLVLLVATFFAGGYIHHRYELYQKWHTPAATPPSKSDLASVKATKTKTKKPKTYSTSSISAAPENKIFLGINTADVREDTSSIQFLNLFKSAIPFAETVPWGSSKEVEYDEHGWPTDLKDGKAGTKFLNRLPEGTIEDGFYTVLYDGEGEIFYGNDARLVVHRPNRDVIEIKAGKDKILNASLFIKKTTKDNYIKNIRILPEGGICEGKPHIKVKTPEDCGTDQNPGKYVAFDLNDKNITFNPDYLNFMKDFQVIRFMNMQGMTRNPVENWSARNVLEKATWGGRAGLYSRGAPVEVMVELANEVKAHPWFSMPYKANDDYMRKFAEYVKANLDPELKVYIEYSNEVWNPIFIHHDYAIEKGLEAKLDEKKSPAGYKWYSRRSVEVFKIWEEVFGGSEQLVRTMGSWASNQNMSSQILAFEDAYKHTDAIAIGPYVSAHPKELRKAENVDDVFEMMMDKDSKWGMKTIISYIQKQEKVATSFGVDLLAYEGGQHLVDWDTRKVEQHPNPLLYAANRDPRMGIVYDELMNEWKRAGGKLFVAFSAPRIYSWYGSWGIKEHIRQAREDAPKYDSLLRYLDNSLNPELSTKPTASVIPEEKQQIKVVYAKNPQMIWNMANSQALPSKLTNVSDNDLSAQWQANWDSKHLYFSFSVKDNDLQEGDELTLTLDTPTEIKEEVKPKEKAKVAKDVKEDKAEDKTENAKTAKDKTTAKTEDKKETKEAVEEKEDEIVGTKTFTFTPFDALGSQTQLTKTDTGYLLNAAIPWKDIYTDKKVFASNGNEIGINIKVTDVDEDIKGRKTIYWVDGNEALPKVVLSNTQ